ncbi:unnamed protein product [Adineta ricciae]|uniref:Dopey N-terminal domain-containing protein n=1 Tax=Adineta ricciae TaxID=249248 RepID=A0A814NKR7_ADIRI|nr:unnamed protein product [Adineta ricciae]
MPTQPTTFVCRFCYASSHALYPVRLYCISLNEGLIMCANQNCKGVVDGHVDLLKLILPLTSSTSQLTYEQYQQTPYYKADNRYDNFVKAVDRVLRQFERSSEWTDLISILIAVKQTLIGNCAQCTFIPKRLTLTKRLAQCLHPALPSGVHIKTLEIYTIIFDMIDRVQLQRDILLYSYGLFPLLPVAALTVRPVLLTLYEKYFLPLDEALNPILTGFLIGLLSALEENGDFYDRIIRLLDNLANRTDEMYFYTCIWSAVRSVSTVRYSAIKYILKHFSKRQSLKDQIYLIGLSIDKMVSAVCICLYDNEQPLVQRSMLDFLLICLPLHIDLLTKGNMIKIITMTFHILLKRDAALNRRIYSWFVGTNEAHVDTTSLLTSSSYFNIYTREILIESLKYLLDIVSMKTLVKSNESSDENAEKLEISSMWTLTKVIRVLLVLVEKDDVGPEIIEFIFMHYLRTIYQQAYCPSKRKEQENAYAETFKTFSTLLDTLEPYFICEELTKSFEVVVNQQTDEKCLIGDATVEQICGITDMLLEIFSAESFADIQSEYLVEMFERFMTVINTNMKMLTTDQIVACVGILLKLLRILNLTVPSKEIIDIDIEEETEQLTYHNNEYSTDIYNKLLRTDSVGNLQNPEFEDKQENLDDIEQLLHEMVRTIEKKMLKSNNFSSVRKQTHSLIHIDNSIRLYKILFHQFITTYIIYQNGISMADRFQTLYSIIQNKTNEIFKLPLNPDVDDYQPAFDLHCKLLLEFCCVLPKQTAPVGNASPAQFEDWFVDLIILAFCQTPLQAQATSVLIEICSHSLNNHHLCSFEQVLFLLNETEFFRYIVAYLWEYLSEKCSRECKYRASCNLSSLHSMLPNDLCEDYILKNFEEPTSEWEVMEKYKRFFHLWNSTRDRLSRSFQSCLVHVLNRLNDSKDSCLKLLIQQWVYDCFVHGDIYRFFDIFMMQLLDVDTTRREIQRVDWIVVGADSDEIQFVLPMDADDNDENDYAETDDDKRVLLNCINPGEPLSQVRSSPQSIKFPSFSSLSPSIFSNILSLSTKPRTPTLSPSALLNSSYQTHSVPTTSSTISEDISQLINSPYDYILFYNGTYDFERIITSLTIIENLLDLIPDQLVQYLLRTSSIQSASMNMHNKQMHELYRKQMDLIVGKDFDLSTEEHQSYLYVLLNILLMFTYSYQEKCHDIQENHRVQVRCLVLLARVCHHVSSICMENGDLSTYVVSLMKKIAFQKIVLCLFNRIIKPSSHFSSCKTIYDLNNQVLHEQSIKQYLKHLVQLLEELILLENIISHADINLIQQFIVNQELFISTILQYLKQIHSIENHRYIISLVVRILPHCGTALKLISTRVIGQMCQNLCFVAQYHSQQDVKIKFENLVTFDTLEYIIHLIERLSFICNYCLGTNTNQLQHFTPILCPQHWTKRLSITAIDISDARRLIFKKLPLILSVLAFVWKTIGVDQTNSIWVETRLKQIHEAIIELVSSLTKANGTIFMRTVAQYWGEGKPIKDIISEKQTLISILININNLTINDMIYYMNELLLQNSFVVNEKKKPNYVVWCLQFLLTYFEQQKNLSNDYWPRLAAMLKECLSFSMSSLSASLIIKILSYFVKQSSVFVEKRDTKDFQDITMKVLEYCNTTVASSLKQTAWLRKNLQVRVTQSELDNTKQAISESSYEIDSEGPVLDLDDTSQTKKASLNALTVLAEYAAKLLDVVYNLTDDKDRVVLPYLQNLIPNIMPYIRTHTVANVLSNRAASTLLMNIAQYSYTRKTWKKDVVEYFFNVEFFQVEISTLRLWKCIIDKLIADGKSTFREVLNRIHTVQTGLRVSKEQEYEQRAMLIKRFAFILYASEKDQYHQYLPEILTRIEDLQKLPSMPILQTQLFLLLRVLLIRISSRYLVSFWPIIISELIHILLKIEQNLTSDVEEDVRSSTQRLPTSDPASLTLYLYACKLLDILVTIPPSELYHFQLFRSAFVDDYNLNNQVLSPDTFTTFSIRISKLFDEKCQSLPISSTPTCPHLRLQTITTIDELRPFFHCLSTIYLRDTSHEQTDQIELSVLEDFVEPCNQM